MRWMSRFGIKRVLTSPLILVLLWSAACSRPAGGPAMGALQDTAAPFRPDSHADPTDPSGESVSPPENGLPFRDPQLPAGTLLTVRLKTAITAGTSISANSFEGVVDEPVIIDGNTLIPRGASVIGLVQSARISAVKPNRAFVRLALQSIHIGDLDVPVQTASLFTRETPQSDELIRVENGRRLTFRLSDPLSLTVQRAKVGR